MINTMYEVLKKGCTLEAFRAHVPQTSAASLQSKLRNLLFCSRMHLSLALNILKTASATETQVFSIFNFHIDTLDCVCFTGSIEKTLGLLTHYEVVYTVLLNICSDSASSNNNLK